MNYPQQRGYPMDVESSYRPTYLPKYVMLSGNGDPLNLRPPPHRRNLPRYHSRSSERAECPICRLFCCLCAFLFLFAAIFAVLLLYLYVAYEPKIPTYKVDDLRISAFEVEPDFSLFTEFIVAVRAENPNKKIGIIYGKNSAVSVTYMGSNLCLGRLPAFYQAHHNTTVMKVVLKGKSEFGSGLQEALMDGRESGRIPLDIYVRVPVSLVLGSLELMQVKVLVDCSLVVDSLSPNKKIGIISSKYKIGFRI